MPSMTELREKVFSVVQDSARNYITEGDVDQWLLEGIEDLTSRLHIIQDSETGTTTDNTLTIPANFSEPIWLKITNSGSDDDFVQWVDEDQWNSYQEQGASPFRRMARVFNGQIEIYPTPDSGTAYELRYWAIGSDLTGLNVTHRQRIVYYASARARLKEHDSGDYQEYMSLYERGLPAPNDFSSNSPVMPDAVSMEAGPFDTVESTHI